MSPILQTLKTSGSCFWCQKMNFISIFDSFLAFGIRPRHHWVYSRYIRTHSLYMQSISKAITLLKTLKTLRSFRRNPSIPRNLKDRKRKKIMSAAENYCDYANSFSFTSLGICFLSTPHFRWNLYSKSFNSAVLKNNFVSQNIVSKK